MNFCAMSGALSPSIAIHLGQDEARGTNPILPALVRVCHPSVEPRQPTVLSPISPRYRNQKIVPGHIINAAAPTY